jgi:hypothetical protein
MKFSAIFTSLIASASAQKPLKEWLFDPSVPSDVTIAQGTPDATPPDWKAICEKISGDDDVASDLCVDYCVEIDCSKKNKPPKVVKTCNQLNEDYKTRTGADIPCGKCPCIGGLQGWADALISMNATSVFQQQITDHDKRLYQDGTSSTADLSDDFIRASYINSAGYGWWVYASSVNVNCNIFFDDPYHYMYLDVTVEQADACISVITARAKTLGFTTLN